MMQDKSWVGNDKWLILESVIKTGKSFFLYRLPNEECRYGIQYKGSPLVLRGLDDLDGEKGWIIAPFSLDGEEPVYLIQPDEMGYMTLPVLDDNSNRYPDKLVSDNSLKKDYFARFHVFSDALRNGICSKLVLSRSISLPSKTTKSLFHLFQRACFCYPNSFVYLQYIPQIGFWLGATPEILLSGSREAWHTMALAGTQMANEDLNALSWDSKNRDEQEYVAGYIRSRLQEMRASFSESGPQTVRAGQLAHLKSEFHFVLPEDIRIGKVLKLLHPTPAVCGLPKEIALQYILKNEGYSRSYYSGFVGWVDSEGRTDLYVNLRCLHQKDSHLSLYAGGGLLESSQVESEWEETQRKLQTLYRLM